jgi:voltage-gated sodium channel
MLVVQVVEILLRIYAYKWKYFWNVPDDVFSQLANRYDFLIVLFTVALYTLTRFSGHTPFYGFAPVGAPDRAVLAVPLFRVFTAVPSIRRLVLGLVFAAPLYATLALMLFCIIYIYAVVGVSVFVQKFWSIPGFTGNFGSPSAVFDSFTQAFITLYQMLVMAGWSSTMQSATTWLDGGERYSLYFISFVIIVGLLFTNLLIGLISNAYQRITELTQHDRKVSLLEMHSVFTSSHGEGGVEAISVDVVDNRVTVHEMAFMENLPVVAETTTLPVEVPFELLVTAPFSMNKCLCD